MSRSKDIGTRAETAVVRFLRTAGWPHAERRALAGAQDLGDVTGTPGIVWEVKARKNTPSDTDVAGWMDETETERRNASAGIGVLIVRRRGVGEGHAGRWWAYLPAGTIAALAAYPHGDVLIPQDAHPFPARMLLRDAVALLHTAGFGTPDGSAA